MRGGSPEQRLRVGRQAFDARLQAGGARSDISDLVCQLPQPFLLDPIVRPSDRHEPIHLDGRPTKLDRDGLAMIGEVPGGPDGPLADRRARLGLVLVPAAVAARQRALGGRVSTAVEVVAFL